MSVMENKAASIPFPVAVADSTGLRGVHRVANSGANQPFTVPSAWKGKWLSVQACGADVQVALGTSAAPTLTYNPPSAIGTGSAASGATAFAVGAPVEGIVPLDCGYLSWIAASATGYTEVRCTELPALGIKIAGG